MVYFLSLLFTLSRNHLLSGYFHKCPTLGRRLLKSMSVSFLLPTLPFKESVTNALGMWAICFLHSLPQSQPLLFIYRVGYRAVVRTPCTCVRPLWNLSKCRFPDPVSDLLNLINGLLWGGAWVSEFLMGFPGSSYATVKSASAEKRLQSQFYRFRL